MSADYWDVDVSDNFEHPLNPDDWSAGAPPGPLDDAILDAAGATFTVTATGDQTVNSIQLSANAILNIYEHISLGQYNFNATNGTGAGTNAGTIEVQDGSTFTAGGVISNTGAIVLEYAPSHAAVLAFAANTSLTGAGVVTIGGGVNDIIEGAGAAVTVTNVHNTISGGGRIGGGSMSLVNRKAGVIDASGTIALTLYAPGATQTVTNAGLIEATGSGGLEIASTTIKNSGGGVILAANGSTVSLLSADIVGGALSTSGTGAIQTIENGEGVTTSTLDGSTSAVTNSGLLHVNAITILDVVGSIINSGTILLENTSDVAAELVAAGNASLTGAGTLTLGGGANDIVTGAAASDTLTNVDDTITGGGQLGAGGLTLVNQSAGVIDASGTIALTLDTGTASVANAGLIEATGTGGMDIVSTTVANTTTGVILAASGSTISLVNAEIVGGTLSTSGNGAIQTLKNGNGVTTSTLDGSTSAVTNSGLLEVNAITTLDVAGAIINSGTILLENTSDVAAELMAAGNASLTGAGTLTLGDGANDIVTGAAASDTLTNVGNTITGGGQLGAGELTLVNQSAGVIDANGTIALTLNTGAATIDNAGLIEATGSGGAVVDSAIKNTGTLEANGGSLTLEAAVTGSGGKAVVASGTLTFGSTFKGAVDFTGTSGQLVLAHSLTYTGHVSGFSKNGGTSLDLKDVSFANAAEATFSGVKKSGVLTVTDGTHTAQIKLSGDYLGLTFMASSDGHGGVSIVAGPAAAPSPPPSAPPTMRTTPFIAAMAGLGAEVMAYGGAFREGSHIPATTLARPGTFSQ